MGRRRCRALFWLVAGLLALAQLATSAQPCSPATPSPSTLSKVTLTAKPSSGQMVGATVNWTATAVDSKPLEYQFSVQQGSGSYVVTQDYSPNILFKWTPMAEGNYNVQVLAREVGTT